jgi:hypothetical protein
MYGILKYFTYYDVGRVCNLQLHVGFPQEFFFLGRNKCHLNLIHSNNFTAKIAYFFKTDSVYVFEKTVENYFGNL